MNTVKIPVSPMTACYLMSIYGAPPLRVPWSSPLNSQLNIFPSKKYSSGRIHNAQAVEACTSSIEIRVGHRLRQQLERNGLAVGWHLHNATMHAMCIWVRAHHTANESNTIASGVRSFCKAHNIDPYILDEDTAYKRYQRFMEKISSINIDELPFPCTKSTLTKSLPLSLEESIQVSLVLHERFNYFTRRRPSYSAILCFIAGSFGKITMRVVAAHLKINPLTAGQNYRRGCKRFVRDKDFAGRCLEAIAELRGDTCVLEPRLSPSAYSLL